MANPTSRHSLNTTRPWLIYVADLWARATPDDPDAMAALIDLPRRTQLMNEIWDLTDRFTRQLGVHLPRQSRTDCR